MLAWTIYLSFAGAIVLAILPKATGPCSLLALSVAVAGLAFAIAASSPAWDKG